MRGEDVTDTLDMALAASGCEKAHVRHRPRLLSDNGASYIVDELADYIKANAMSHVRGAPFHPLTQRHNQTLAPDPEEPHPAGKLIPARRSRAADRGVRRALQSPALAPKPGQRHANWRLLRPRHSHHQTAKKDQTKDIQHRRLQHRKIAA